MAIGGFTFVLHGHLPYVLRHGIWPHGEDWLYEAAAETYLPILDVIGHCALHGASPKLTIGLTPVLLEQLAHEHFKKGFEHYLHDRLNRAAEDRAEFEKLGNGHMVYLAEQWTGIFEQLMRQFAAINRDIPKAFARHALDGHIELLTSAATHAYLPVMYEDSTIRAQIRAGVASSKRILGFQPTGMWLPECAYRPGGGWHPPNQWAGKDNRVGIETLVADEGITHFFVENHLIERSNSERVFNDGQWWKVSWDEARQYPGRGWRNVQEPHGVYCVYDQAEPRVTAFARDPRICEQVWSGAIGYPADGAYLEFHKKWGARRGLRYWKITGNKVDLGDKHLYHPPDTVGRVYEHAQHFANAVKDRLWSYHHQTGRYGMVTATFDAELFGHWWFEGPQFIRDVILSLNADPDIDLVTSAQMLRDHPPDKVVAMPEGSWGEEGDHRVWTRDSVKWMWDIEYRCEANFGKATIDLPWQQNKQVENMLKQAARELLLLQASDWPFVISRGQAIDYGIKRFMQHVSRFETMIDLAERVARDSTYLGKLNDIEQFEVQDAELHDIIFPEIDLNWWRM